MAKQARSAVGAEELTVLADRGYFKGEEILDCEQAQITTLVPKPLPSNSKADGRFDKRDFVYIAQSDEYRCPAGQRAIKRFTTIERGMTLHKYWSSACPKWPIAQITSIAFSTTLYWIFSRAPGRCDQAWIGRHANLEGCSKRTVRPRPREKAKGATKLLALPADHLLYR
jgi:hypothetical protein